MANKTLEYYKRLPYTLFAMPQEDENGNRYWTAEYLELRGCKTEGETELEAIANVQALFDEYITSLLEEKIEIEEPGRTQSVDVEEITIIRRGTVLQSVAPNMPVTQNTRDMVSPNYDNALV